MKNLRNEVIHSIASSMPKELESYSNEDMVVFKPRFFVSGENQFDCYHFTMPKVPMPKLSVDGKESTVFVNSIFPSNPGQKLNVMYTNNENPVFSEVKYVSVFIDKYKLQDLSKTIYNKSELYFKNENNSIDYSLMEAVRNFSYESKNKQSGYEFILDSIVTQISVIMLRQFQNNSACSPKRHTFSCRNEIKAAVDFLWENINMKFSLNDLCKIANLSPYYFIRLFKETMEQTPYEYYMGIKVERSLQFLKEGKHSITEISYMLGFSSQSHFTAIFKKKMGIAPSEFAKLNK